MKRVFLFGLLAVVVLSCDKDSFETRPQLEFKKASTDIVPLNSALEVELSYTDKEGDLDSVFVVRHRLNKKNPGVVLPVLNFGIPPDFKNDTKGDIVLTLFYQTHLIVNMTPISIPGTGGKLEPDTVNMRFVLLDKEKNSSDTVNKVFVIIR